MKWEQWFQPFKRLDQGYWVPLLVGTIGTIAVLDLWQQALVQEKRHIEHLVQQEANAIESQLSRDLSTQILGLQQMANRWQASGGTPQVLWEADAADYIDKFYGYQAIEWVDSSFHVRWIVPLATNKAAQNLDMSREPHRQITLSLARDLRQTILTNNISLVQGGKGFLVSIPLFVRESRFDGFILGVFRYQYFFDTLLKLSPRYKVQIYDHTQLIYSQATNLNSTFKKTVLLKAYSADWQVQIFPTSVLILEAHSPLPNIILWGGLVGIWTLAFTLYLGQCSEQNARRARKINQQLQEEIIQRQQAEANLREKEERWQLALRGNNDGIWDWNVQTNEIVYSPRYKEILGYAEHEHGNYAEDRIKLLHPDDRDRVIQAVQDHLANQTPFYISEHRVLCKDGSYKWILDRGQALWDEAGNVIRMTGSHTDINERKQAEFERQELIIALENTVAGISQLDPQGRYVFVNRAYASIVGYQPQEMVGMLWEKTVHPDDLEKLVAAYQQMQQDGKVEVEARGIRRDGSTFYKQVVMISIHDEQQQFIGHHCFMKDISERKQAEAALQEEFQRLSVIIATQQEIAIRNPNLNEVMAVIAERAQYLTHADGAVIELIEGEEIVYRATSGIAAPYIGLRLQIATSLSGRCIMSGEILYCHDSETDSRVDLAACRRIGVRSMVVVPLLYLEERVGVLKVFSTQISAFTESDIQTLQLMAGFLAGSLHLASEFDAKNLLLSELKESEQRYCSVITSMTEGVVLQLANGQVTACNPSAERILGLTPNQMMGRTSVDLDWRTIQEDGSPFPGEQHPAMITLRTGQPLTNVVMGICKADQTLTWISINSQPLFHPHQSIPYAVVTTFADITEQKRAEKMLRHQVERQRFMAMTDALTQVANRRYFDERLQWEWQRLMREQQVLSLIMLDIDYFKRYNDYYGHQGGDTCLVQVAKAAAEVKRSFDLFARYGGEEFAVILPHTDTEGAIAVAERIRQAIRELRIPHQQSDVSLFVTVSMGIATIIPRLGQSPDELIALADQALYHAKQQGRDRYSINLDRS